jgi:hypothetical protein
MRRRWCSVTVTVVALAGWGGVALEPQLAHAQRHKTCVDGIVFCTGAFRSCPQVAVPGVQSNLADIDVFGRPLARCGPATAQLRRVRSRLRQNRWGHVGRWRCKWGFSSVVCATGQQVIWASNPGD